MDGREKRKKNSLSRLTLPIAGLGKRQTQKSFNLLGVTLDCRFKFQEHAKKKKLLLLKKSRELYEASVVYTMVSLAKL